MYVDWNFKTKKALKDAVKAGTPVGILPGLGGPPDDGEVSVEGPWYPAAHTFYARVVVKDGLVVKVKS